MHKELEDSNKTERRTEKVEKDKSVMPHQKLDNFWQNQLEKNNERIKEIEKQSENNMPSVEEIEGISKREFLLNNGFIETKNLEGKIVFISQGLINEYLSLIRKNYNLIEKINLPNQEESKKNTIPNIEKHKQAQKMQGTSLSITEQFRTLTNEKDIPLQNEAQYLTINGENYYIPKDKINIRKESLNKLDDKSENQNISEFLDRLGFFDKNIILVTENLKPKDSNSKALGEQKNMFDNMNRENKIENNLIHPLSNMNVITSRTKIEKECNKKEKTPPTVALIGESIKVSKNARLYVNATDSILERNAYQPYLDSDVERVILGEVIEHNGELINIFANVPNHNHAILTLKETGGKIVSYLTANKKNTPEKFNILTESQILEMAEGFYNPKNIVFNVTTKEVLFNE